MARNDKKTRLVPSGQDGSAQQAVEAPHVLFTDVRSAVEGQFRQMDQDHDRIRIEELAARLAPHAIN